ncbi:MAG TPA: tyrosine-protein phosphatase [Acidimicrobiales bacterium]
MELAGRQIVFDACFNFRDVGGYETADGGRVRTGVLYRADTLHRLTPADVEVVRGLGLRTVIDLRTPREAARHGRAPLGEDEVVHLHLPMIDDEPDDARDDGRPGEPPPSAEPPSPEERAGFYLAMLERGGAAVAAAFRALAAPDALPAVFHCTAGKDRTGVLAALVLGHLGVPDDVIAADYALTERARARFRAWAAVHEPDTAAATAALPAWMQETRAEVMLAFLDRVRQEHGSVPQLLADLGLGPPTLDGLRDRLLEPGPAG